MNALSYCQRNHECTVMAWAFFLIQQSKDPKKKKKEIYKLEYFGCGITAKSQPKIKQLKSRIWPFFICWTCEAIPNQKLMNHRSYSR